MGLVLGWTCAACEGTNPDGTRFCGHCGTRREEGAGPSTVAAPARDERRVVTSLFADISGFTTLADRVEDAEALHEVISPIISGLAAIAERYEGTIAKYAGDALLVFFGAPIAHEDDPERALLVALEMHDALPRMSERLGEASAGLQLHIGVSTGTVISGWYGGEAVSDYSILGDAVILAQRLESVAPSGETYVAEETMRQVEQLFLFEPIGELELKGKLRKVPAWRLLGRRPPVAVPAVRAGAFVGRREEVATAAHMLDELVSGRGGGTLTLAGDPGIGKSRLLAETRRMAAERGIRWIQTRCPSYGASLPYFPFAQMIRDLAGIAPEHDGAAARRRLDALSHVSPRQVAALAPLVGASTNPGDVVANDPEEARRELHDAVIDQLVGLSGEAPIVVAIEDVHWADPSSVALASHLARATQGWPIALVLSARTEGAELLQAASAGVDAAWRADFQLGLLDRDGIAELVGALLEGRPPAGLVDGIALRTGGNPLFVQEVVRALLDQGDLTVRGGRWRLRPGWDAASVPPTIERVLAARIDLLAPSAATVLQTASVIGRLVRLPLLHAVADLPGSELDGALDRLVQVGLLEPTLDGEQQALQFHHALVQDVAYGRLLRSARRELHQRTAEVAERIYGAGDDVIDLLARHHHLGETGVMAIRYLQQAGERAKRLFATTEALGFYRQSVEVARREHVPDSQLSLLELEVAALHNIRGEYDDALDLYEAAARPGAPARAWAGYADVLRKRGAFERTVAVVDEAFETIDPHSSDAAALWLERGWAQQLAGRLAEASQSLRAGLAVTSPDRPIRGQLLTQLAGTASLAGDFEEALEQARQAQAVCEATHDLRRLVSATRLVAESEFRLGRLDEAAAAFTRALQLAERTGLVEEVAGNLLNLGMVELVRGNLAVAIDHDRMAIERFEELDHGGGLATGYGNLAEKLLLAGELEEAEQWCDRALHRARTIGHLVIVADATRTLARMRALQGRAAEARALFGEAEGLFSELGSEEEVAATREMAAGLADAS